MQAKNKKRKGFTIVEILIVVVIIGILAALVVPRMIDATKQAKLNSALGQHRTVVGQINVILSQKPEITFDDLQTELAKAFPDKWQAPSVITKNGTTTVSDVSGTGFKVTTTSTEVTIPAADGETTILKP